MKKILIIGAGGVGTVVAKKCAMLPEVFEEIVLASRTLSKCEKIRDDIMQTLGKAIKIDQVDADNVEETTKLLMKHKPYLVINVALPYQDLSIMDACLAAGVHYMDTANYEPREEAKFEYSWQWAYQEKFKEKGLMALLGCGFDPGVSSVFCTYLQKHHFDTIETIDILDCNAGDHGQHFMPNFNPEINIREVSQPGKYWKNGEWVHTPSILEDASVHFTFDYPVVGPHESFLIYHEEEESLAKFIKDVKQIRFWMTFSEKYITHLSVLKNVGMTSISPVTYEDKDIVPLKFLQAVLPKSGSVADTYIGKTVIGCILRGHKARKPVSKYIYNVCDHQDAYQETGIHAVAYTTGVPTMIGAQMVLTGKWAGEGVFNVEQFDPDPFMEELMQRGLPWKITDFNGTLPE